MAKEFIFEQFLAESRTIDRGEFLIGPSAFFVNRLCEHLLTCSCFTGQQYGGIGNGYF